MSTKLPKTKSGLGFTLISKERVFTLISLERAFTLIELLVVITILAILAVIGFAAYRGFTTKGNDARRDADLKAISAALEANKGTASYVGMATSQFANGAVPDDPVTSRHYCISYTTNTTNPYANITTTPAAWTTTTCTAAGNTTGWAAGTTVTGTDFTSVQTASVPNGATAWRVCATMQDNATVHCRNSAQ